MSGSIGSCLFCRTDENSFCTRNRAYQTLYKNNVGAQADMTLYRRYTPVQKNSQPPDNRTYSTEVTVASTQSPASSHFLRTIGIILPHAVIRITNISSFVNSVICAFYKNFFGLFCVMCNIHNNTPCLHHSAMESMPKFPGIISSFFAVSGLFCLIFLSGTAKIHRICFFSAFSLFYNVSCAIIWKHRIYAKGIQFHETAYQALRKPQRP